VAAGPRRLPKALTPDELEALRAVRKNARDRALLETMVGCGLRVSEACSLRLEGVDWGSASVPSLRFVGKRDKERIVPMNHRVQDALRVWLELRGGERGEYVFCNLRTGGRLSRKTVWDAFRRYSQRAGVRRVHPHMLRHTFGTNLADRDVPVERIRELMGHASIQTSQVYISVSAEQKRAAVERLDSRPRLARWLSRQRNRTYRFWPRTTTTPSLGRVRTTGRQAELGRLQTNLERGIHTLLIGPVGVGKSHLLELLDGEHLIRLPGLSPPRQMIIALAEQLHGQGVRFVSVGETEARGRAHSPAGIGETASSVDAESTHSRKEPVQVDSAVHDQGNAPGPTAKSVAAVAVTAPAPLSTQGPAADTSATTAPSHVIGSPDASAETAVPLAPTLVEANGAAASANPAPADTAADLSEPPLVEPSTVEAASPADPLATDPTPPGATTSEDFKDFARQHTRTSVAAWTTMVADAVPQERWTLVVDDLSDLTVRTVRLLDRLAAKFVILGAIRHIRPQLASHFGRFDQIPLVNLGPGDTCRLVRQAAAGAPVEDWLLLETHLWQQTAGNPRAILESVGRLRKEPEVTRHAVRQLSHPGPRSQIDLTPFVVVALISLMAFRYIARGIGNTELYIFAAVASVVGIACRLVLMRAR
jgi:hypothetical protein